MKNGFISITAVLVICVSMVGCTPLSPKRALTQDEEIQQIKKCEDAGLSLERHMNEDGETYRIECAPSEGWHR